MTARRPCSVAPGPLEAYAREFDDLFGVLAQREGFRAYLQGLLLPRDRNKTLTGLTGSEPVVGAQAAPVQRLQFFLSESSWDAAAVNGRRLETLWTQEELRPHAEGVLIVDDSGDRKAGSHTAHVGRQYLGSIGKIDNGIVAVTTVWADERVYYPLHYAPYTPASRLPKGMADPAFRTKPQLAAALITQAQSAGVPFRAIVADCFYGDHLGFVAALETARLPYVLAVKPSKGTWAPAEAVHTPQEAAQELHWESPEAPGDWAPVRRRFRDGHEETWWAAELTLGGRGPDRRQRLVVTTTDPATLPPLSTWYLLTNLPRPSSPRAATTPWAPAALEELVRLYGLRLWVEQSYKQVKGHLGWADFQVRSDAAIQRHWQLVCCAFAFCWWAWFRAPREERDWFGALAPADPAGTPGPPPTALEAAGRGENRPRHGRRSAVAARLLAGHPAAGAGLADALGAALALVARVVHAPAAPRTPGVAGRGRPRP
ncbi:MAG TPA: IS701 family transposase, partial [Myxococcota bacterium]|nr:IS701 family transposase [Myxococcota bacterium]